VAPGIGRGAGAANGGAGATAGAGAATGGSVGLGFFRKKLNIEKVSRIT
jgi:hypothetical protein